MLTQVELWPPKALVQTLAGPHPHKHTPTALKSSLLLFSLSENHARLHEKIGNKRYFLSSEANLKMIRVESSPFCQRQTGIVTEIKCRMKEIKTQSYVPVQLVGRESNQLSVPGILGVSTLRSEVAVPPCAPGPDGRLLTTARN